MPRSDRLAGVRDGWRIGKPDARPPLFAARATISSAIHSRHPSRLSQAQSVQLRRIGGSDPSHPNHQEEPDQEEVHKEEEALCCRDCLQPITTLKERIEKDGKHQHTFFNPHGVVFRIGCFARAPGCVNVGELSGEFSWFRGTLWQISLCRQCQTHLGWRFSGQEGTLFFGLILARLVQMGRGGGKKSPEGSGGE
ncbi:MAG: hypothetical protein HQL52_04345 [Magnetococcales bacterium]|nr:hypothetical protein [Magnetococcales bacterium]